MAQTFKNARAVLTTTASVLYTCPANTTAIITGCQVTNVDSTARNLSLLWTDDSASDAQTYLASTVSVPVSASYEPIGGKIVLEAGDQLLGFASANSTLHISVSVLEIS
jgi:hypothetical protein